MSSNRSRSACRLLLAALMLTSAGVAQAQLYGRVDVGWSASKNADIQDTDFTGSGLICGDPNCSTPGTIDDVGNSALVSVGVGWRFNPNLRADMTLAYRGWYKIDQTMPDATNLQADVKSLALMLNGYYDFNLSSGMSIYIGAGIGGASNKVDDPVFTNAGAPGLTLTAPGGTKNSFAWALMAGVGIPIGGSLVLDISVRYSDLGKIQTDSGDIALNGVTLPGATYAGFQGNLRAWEATVGLRF